MSVQQIPQHRRRLILAIVGRAVDGGMKIGHGAGDEVGGRVESGVVVDFEVEPLHDLEPFRGRPGED